MNTREDIFCLSCTRLHINKPLLSGQLRPAGVVFWAMLQNRPRPDFDLWSGVFLTRPAFQLNNVSFYGR